MNASTTYARTVTPATPPRRKFWLLLVQWFVHSSGRFDRADSLWVNALRRLRKYGVLITGTEAAGRSEVDFARAFGSGKRWAYAHLTGAAAGECWASWDTRVLELDGRAWAHKLTDQTWVRAREYGGKPAAKVHALVVPLRPRRKNTRRIYVVVVHMPLDNTSVRAAAWVSCCEGLIALHQRLMAFDPTADVVLVADWNKNYRDAAERAMIEHHLAHPLNLVQSWRGHIPAHGGTEGSQLIDGALLPPTMFAGKAELVPDDSSSDHRPMRYRVRFGRVVAKVARKGLA